MSSQLSYHSIREEVRQFIKEHTLPFRDSCPVCGRKNTFTASILDGRVFYNCFSVSCAIKGVLEYDLTISDIRSNSLGNYRSIFNNRANSTSSPNQSTNSSSLNFDIPDHWSNVLQNKRCLNFLKYWNLLDLYANRKVHLYYDPKMDRCVFLLLDKKGVCKGATGRNLTYNTLPKWFVYSRIHGCPFIQSRYGNSYTILVEDAISACTASIISNSIALLGTSIPEATIPYLLDYKSIYIALDKDATFKSIKLQKQLAPYVDTKIIPLEKDIKYYSKDDLETLKRKILLSC